MPGRKCVFCGKSSLVTNKEGSNTSYFSFPREESLRKKWIDVCPSKIDNLITARVCSDHFKEEDFFHNKNGETEEVRKKRLKFNVVPSLYLVARGGKQSRNNANIKNINKENPKDSLKKRDSSRDIENIKDQNSVLQSKRKNPSGNRNNKSVREQIKRRSITGNNKHLNLLLRKKNSKGLNNKENTKELMKRKNHLKNISLRIKEIPKQRSGKELLRKKSTSLNNISIKKDLHKSTKKSINKENQMEIIEEKFDNVTSDTFKGISEKKLTRSMMTKSSNQELNLKKSHPGISSKHQNESITENNLESPNKTSENNTEEISVTKEESSLRSDDANKKTIKRRSFMANGVPRKMHKKRIRLGKDDSDSEDSSTEFRTRNNVPRDKITYKSPSEMADNVDLLKYLNYLKEKSRSTDQPILFWVDD